MPGDGAVVDATYSATLVITVDARPEHIWPWLVQMGYRRGGLYSYDWLDRLFGYLDRLYFGRDARDRDQVGYIDANTRAVFGRSYAAEPDVLVKELAGDQAIKVADTVLLTIPNQLSGDYNAHVLDSILKYVAPELGWR